MIQIQKLILEAIKAKGNMSPQAAYAHLSTYHELDVTVDQARRALNSLVVQGHLSKSAGHGSARSSYSIKDKK